MTFGGGSGNQETPLNPPLVAIPSTLPLSNFRAKTDLKNFFMDRCPKDEPIAKSLCCRKSSSHSREKLEKSCWRGVASPCSLGHRRVKVPKNADIRRHKHKHSSSNSVRMHRIIIVHLPFLISIDPI